MTNALSSIAMLKAIHDGSKASRGNSEVRYEIKNLSKVSFCCGDDGASIGGGLAIVGHGLVVSEWGGKHCARSAELDHRLMAVPNSHPCSQFSSLFPIPLPYRYRCIVDLCSFFLSQVESHRRGACGFAREQRGAMRLTACP